MLVGTVVHKIHCCLKNNQKNRPKNYTPTYIDNERSKKQK